MENLYIAATKFTPEVSFEPGLLTLTGRSIPENSVGFYQDLYAWVENYYDEPSDETEVIVQLDYFNTSSAKCILDFLRMFTPIHDSGRTVVVRWHYDDDDDDMLESGEDYQELVGFDFDFISE